MKRLAPFLDDVTTRIALASAQFGARVSTDPAGALDRSYAVQLQAPSRTSANGSCRLLRTADARWIALNLPRTEDRAAAPALVMREQEGDLWTFLERECARWTACELLAQAQVLGMALTELGETRPQTAPCITQSTTRAKRSARLSVIDLSSLWAGPLCGSVFAAMGADVCKIESVERPDTTAISAPALDRRLNGAKMKQRLSFRAPDGLAALHEAIASCDVLITNARARALDGLGLSRDAVFRLNPGLTWIAITAHGWDSDRIGFGDDAAIAGGCVDWLDGEPRFVGDALADPLTGLAAAATALELIASGRSGFIDAALARVAAHAAQTQRMAA